MKTKQPTEAKVKKAVAQWLKTMGLRHWRMNSGVLPMGYQNKAGKFKQRMVRLSEAGTPDFLVLKPWWSAPKNAYGEAMGNSWTTVTWIEVKRPLGPNGGTGGSEQSPEQRAFQAEAERNGERYLVVRSVSDLVEGLK